MMIEPYQSFFSSSVQNPPPDTTPLAIRPTIYSALPDDTVMVEDPVFINVRSAEFRDFINKMDQLIEAIQQSNETGRETRQQIVAELKAGVEYIKASKPSRKVLYVLLGVPLSYAAANFAGNFVGELAKHAADLLIKLLGVN